MQPIVNGLEGQYGQAIDFLRVDIDDPASATLKQELGFRGQPHFILLDGDGQKVQEWFGRVPEQLFVQAFDDILAN